MNAEAIISALHAHTPADREEENHRDQMIGFVSSHPSCWWKRATAPGHVTGSAWILNFEHTHALLLHHRKLNRWVQPGGHLDDTDASPCAGAMREAREETGIQDLRVADDALFDVDIHVIPARPARAGKNETEPAHLHYDVRYLIIAEEDHVTISAESLDAKWMSLQDLVQPAFERSIGRMAEKSLRRGL